jgi:DNA-binding NtrC family response regulator
MISYTIFIVDDEQTIRKSVSMALEDRYVVKTFIKAEEALKAMQDGMPDLVLLDIGLPGMNGIEALARIRDLSHECIVIMITAYEDAPTVIAAMKQGAYDYVIKPLDLDALEASIRRALETVRLRKEVKALQQAYLQENVPCFITENCALQDLMDYITKVAKSPDTPVLIMGETGTGKELIASAIHYRSPNFQGPFITLNCAAIPQHLIESELFGYEKGAFSGAGPAGKKGLIEESSGGTLFLDEVGDLSLEAQAKLLRFLENGEFYRVGGNRLIKVATRVISATNREIGQMIEEKTFRKDLYFRLGVIKVRMPSLNERPEDILPLAGYFLAEFNTKFAKKFTSISENAGKALTEYRWTGNIRELKNIIERTVLIGEGPILEIGDLALENGLPGDAGPSSLPMLTSDGLNLEAVERSVEKHYIEAALALAGGNEAQAARLLNINHHTFRYRRKKIEGLE